MIDERAIIHNYEEVKLALATVANECLLKQCTSQPPVVMHIYCYGAVHCNTCIYKRTKVQTLGAQSTR